MKASEIREMSYEEMAAQLQSLKEELFNLRFQLAANQLENSARLKRSRRISPVSRLACVPHSLRQRHEEGGHCHE